MSAPINADESNSARLTHGRTHPKPSVIDSYASPGQIERGARTCGQCYPCHGIGLAGDGGIVDLRRSHPGGDSYLELGPPAFRQWLSEEDVEAVRSNLPARRVALTAGR